MFETVFMALSSWQIHCQSLPSSSDECRTGPHYLSYQVSPLGMLVHI